MSKVWVIDIIDQWGMSVDFRVTLTEERAFIVGVTAINELCLESGYNTDDFDFNVAEVDIE